jgi:chitin disaccharide deacetylase
MHAIFGRSLKRATIAASLNAVSGTGLLIVNADDLGLGQAETDAILECFERGAITSTTALMWMPDSVRAAELARAAGVPVGLHLNLIEPFAAPDVPAGVAETQLRVVRRLRSRRAATQLYHPTWSRDFEQCIADQLARFQELYGRAPTHVDGHQHMHLAFNALFARALRPVGKCRRPVNRTMLESPPHKRAARVLVDRLLRVRFATTDWCMSIRPLHPALGGSGITDALRRAEHGSLELLVHPGYADERAVLSSPEWGVMLARYRLGSFEDLPARRGP